MGPNCFRRGPFDQKSVRVKSAAFLASFLTFVCFNTCSSTNTAKAVCDLQATYRLALTGTPIQNSLDDLYSLLLFLKFADYPSYADWKHDIGNPIKMRHATGYTKLQQVMRRVLLRRRKNQKLNGEPILILPAVTSHSTVLSMGASEKTFYITLERQSLRLFQELMEQGEKVVMKNYWHVLELLLRLRQVCHFV